MSDAPSAPSTVSVAAAPVAEKKPRTPRAKPPAAKAASVRGSSQANVAAKKALPRSLRRRSKRYRNLVGKVEAKATYLLPEAVKLVKSLATGTKYDQTINLAMHLGIDPKQADQIVRGSVSLPKGIGKSKTVIAFVADDATAELAKKAGAVEAGGDDLIKKVEGGWTDFDVAIATPQMMARVGKLGRVLGPQGKMPSPKNGTVTADVATAVSEFAAGKIEFRNDDGGNIHAPIGKASFPEDSLLANAQAFIEHIRRLKPQTSKGQYVRKISLAGSMSPGVLVQIESQSADAE